MNTIEEFQDKINSYINELCNKSDYSHLKIIISAYVTTNRKSIVSIESDANVGLRNSLMADSMISNYINNLFNDYQGKEKFLFIISYKEKGNRRKEDSVPANSENEVIEHFYVEKPKHKLSSVVLPKPKWEEINRALAMVKNYEKIYKEWGFDQIDPSSKTIICFYGKPGTGKTKCAHGIAERLDKMILCASYADIQSEYVGVGPKNLRNIFRQAENEDAVLFFDEADAFLRKRTTDTSSSAAMHYNSMTNEMMKHLEDFNGLVIFATNLTENIDEAFMTRITATIEFPEPDLEGRVALLKELVPKKVPFETPFAEDDYLNIANKCEGFVGRDIRNAIKATLSNAAESGLVALTPKLFEEGFEQYKLSKSHLEDDITGKKTNNTIYAQIEWNSATSLVMAICTFMAWYDGVETEEETEKLKQIAKLLNRDKLVITKLSDLPNLEELCESIKKKKHQIETLKYCASILSTSGDEAQNIDMLRNVCAFFNLDNTILEEAKKFYSIEKQRNVISFEFDNLLNTND